MLENILNLAENIGKGISNKLFSDNTKTKNKSRTIETIWKTYYKLMFFKNNQNWLDYWKSFLWNFSNLKENIQISIIWNKWEISFYVSVSNKLSSYFENTFYANFPTSNLEKIKKTPTHQSKYINFNSNTNFYDNKYFTKWWKYIDPFKDLLSIFGWIQWNSQLIIEYNYKFNISSFEKFCNRIIGMIKSKLFWKNTKNNLSKWDTKNWCYINVWYRVIDKDPITKDNIWKNLKDIFAKFINNGNIKLSNKRKYSYILFNQVSNFFHILTEENYIKNINYIEYRKLPYPNTLPTRENSEKNWVTIFATTDYKSEKIRFGIRTKDKFQHMYIVWKTWTWKSTLISNIIRSDIYTNNWLCVIDPHWDLIETIIEHIPSRRTNDVILFDISDTNYPIGFNIFQHSSEEEKNLIISWLMSVFNRLWEWTWSSRMEYILRNTLMAVIEYPDATFMHVIRLLNDDNFRQEVLSYVKDSVVLKFWNDEFKWWNERYKTEAVSPIINKIWQLLSSPVMRNVFWQPKSKLNIRKIMDEWKILLVNLSKWKIWEDNMMMLWSFLVTKFQIDAMSRADIKKEQDRKDFFLYIDEFQNFTTDSFESIFSEARKYKLSLIVANQYISQVSEKIRNAIFGNIWTIVSFTLWYDDAQIMSSQFKNIVTPNDLLSLPKFKAYTRLKIDGIDSDPFNISTFPLPSPEAWNELKDKIRKQSRQRYSMDKKQLEILLETWSDKKFNKVEKAIEKAKKQSKQTQNNKENIDFDINNIKIWEWYEWLVKLKYNYWLFVMVKWAEWLLHKKVIDTPEWVRWKDLYEIWSPIKVKAEDIKEVEWEKKVVWTQK